MTLTQCIRALYILASLHSVSAAVVHVPVVLVAEVDAEVGVDGAHHVHQPARHEPDLPASLNQHLTGNVPHAMHWALYTLTPLLTFSTC